MAKTFTTEDIRKQDLESAYQRGWYAFYAGDRYADCPLLGNDKELQFEWSKGWLAADEDTAREAARYDAQNEAYNGN